MKKMMITAGVAGLCVATAALAAAPPQFSLAWSEYPSWSTFGVAHEYKLIDGRAGELGPIEEKWGVDIVLKEADYDTCIVMYGAGECDAACLTNMDSLPPSLARPSVAILPTSTSMGGDACIVTEAVKAMDDLKNFKVYGLSKTVSEYCFSRVLEKNGHNEDEYLFTNMDPGAAALAMQQKQKGFDAIMVWNPYVLETLNKRQDTRVLFDSTAIPGEIIDMVTVARAALDRPKGGDFACAVIDTFYAVNKLLADPKTRDDALIALGEKFSHLDLASMKKVVEQTLFYGSPEAGLKAFDYAVLMPTMDKVVAFCVAHEMVDRPPALAYGAGQDGVLRFDQQFMMAVQARNAQ